MEYETIKVERRDNIGVVYLNRPEVRNALNNKLKREMIDALSKFEEDDEIRVLVIRSTHPDFFCAGNDLSELKNIGDVKAIKEQFALIGELVSKIFYLKKPTIAMVNGYALAGGCGLVCACDFAIASEDSVFGLPEVNIGLFPMTITPVMIQSIGYKRFLQLSCLGKRINAEEALRMGMITKVVPKERLEDEVMELARELASKSPIVMALGREGIKRILDMDMEGGISYGSNIVSLIASTEDAKEGFKAFLEKRKPLWKGK